MEAVPEALSQKFRNMAIVCAILVVFIHIHLFAPTPGEPLWVFQALIPFGISKVGVPFFFLASGYFLAGHIGENGWWKRELLKRVRTLLVPFFLWNVIFILYNLCLACTADLLAHRALGTSLEFAKGLGYPLLGLYPLEFPPLGPTWYIRTLLLLVLLSPALVWALKRFPWVLIFGAWALSIYAFPDHGFDLSVRSFFSPEGLTYFALGIYLRKHPIHIEGRGLWVWSVILAVVLLAVRLWQSYTGAFEAISLGTFSIPFMLYAVWGLIPAKPWPKAFTSLAFACYLMHVLVTRMLSFVTTRLGLLSTERHELAYFLIVFTVPLTLLLGYALRRCFPKTAAVLFGGR